MRLPRNRRGKTPIDVTITNQEAGPRVRISVGEDYSAPSAKKNSDLTVKETEDLITLLQWHLLKITDGIPVPEESTLMTDPSKIPTLEP